MVLLLLYAYRWRPDRTASKAQGGQVDAKVPMQQAILSLAQKAMHLKARASFYCKICSRSWCRLYACAGRLRTNERSAVRESHSKGKRSSRQTWPGEGIMLILLGTVCRSSPSIWYDGL